MKFKFKDKDPKKALSSIQEKLEGRKLGEMVSLKLDGGNLEVTISKLGTSKMEFSYQEEKDGGMSWKLSKEKIALAHRAFKDDVAEKLKGIVRDAGGAIS